MNWNEIILLLSIILICILFSKQLNIKPYYEGFTQKKPYILKTNDNMYDGFYAAVYDDLFKSNKRSYFEAVNIVKMTNPSDDSVILDVGSGTGELLNNFYKVGLNAQGIEKSNDMIEYSNKAFPNVLVNKGDVLNSMAFDNNTFTHICCMNFMIYHLKDKKLFFKNCYHWLLSNGYLIIHLVNPEKYDTSVPAANPLVNDNPQKYVKERIKKTNIDFIDFRYLNQVDFKNNNEVVVKETFTDGLTKHVRENELTLYMENLDEILSMAFSCGFLAKSKIKYENDDEQFIYILEKQM